MLKQRIITSLIVTPLAIGAVFGLSDVFFTVFIISVLTLAAREWADMIGLNGKYMKVVYVVAVIIVLLGIQRILDHKYISFDLLIYITLIWWVLRIIRVLSYRGKEKILEGIHLGRAINVIIVLIIPLLMLIYLRNNLQSPGRLLYLLMLIWAADIAAYFAGKYFGKHRLAPYVSPGKTWEGVLGALAITVPAAVIGGVSFSFSMVSIGYFWGLSLFVVMLSIFGDLSESLYKRQSAIKDSGHLLPGHGGMLDRIDSLCSAAPLYMAGMIALGLMQ